MPRSYAITKKARLLDTRFPNVFAVKTYSKARLSQMPVPPPIYRYSHIGLYVPADVASTVPRWLQASEHQEGVFHKGPSANDISWVSMM